MFNVHDTKRAALSLLRLLPFEGATELVKNPLDLLHGERTLDTFDSIGRTFQDAFGSLSRKGVEKYFSFPKGIVPQLGLSGGGIQAGGPALPIFLLLALLIHVAGGLLLHQSLETEEVSDGDFKEPRPLTRKEALIEEARSSLLHPSRRNYAHFLAGIEGLRRGVKESQETEMLVRWDDDMASYKADLAGIADPRKRTYALMHKLYWDYYRRYARGKGDLIDGLARKKHERKGDCRYETKLTCSAFEPMDIALKDGEGFAIQVFRNHAQPVIYKRDADGEIVEVQNLISGEKEFSLMAPIFEPPILYVGFLKKQGVASPLEFDDFLIARPKKEDLRTKPGGGEREIVDTLRRDDPDASILFPPSDAIYLGTSPKDGILLPPDFGDMPEAHVTSNAGDDEKVSWTGRRALTFEEYRNTGQILPYGEGSAEDPYEFSYGINAIAFRTPGLVDQFLRLKSAEEEDRFLGVLTAMQLDRIELRFKKLVRDPFRQIPAMNASELRKADEAIRRYFSMRHQTAAMAGLYYANRSSSFQDCKRRSGDDNGGCFESLFKEAGQKVIDQFGVDERPRQTLIDAIDKKPEAFLAMYNATDDPEKRAAILGLMSTSSHHYPLNKPRALLEFLRDSARCSIARAPSLESSFTPVPNDAELIWMEFPERDPSASPIPEPASGTFRPSSSGIVISPESMVELALMLEDRGVADRWDERMSAAFRRLNRDGSLKQKLGKLMALYEPSSDASEPVRKDNRATPPPALKKLVESIG